MVKVKGRKKGLRKIRQLFVEKWEENFWVKLITLYALWFVVSFTSLANTKPSDCFFCQIESKREIDRESITSPKLVL